jgi:hypothetical protein
VLLAILIWIMPHIRIQGEEAVGVLERLLRLCVRRVGVQPQLQHLPACVSIRQHLPA